MRWGDVCALLKRSESGIGVLAAEGDATVPASRGISTDKPRAASGSILPSRSAHEASRASPTLRAERALASSAATHSLARSAWVFSVALTNPAMLNDDLHDLLASTCDEKDMSTTCCGVRPTEDATRAEAANEEASAASGISSSARWRRKRWCLPDNLLTSMRALASWSRLSRKDSCIICCSCCCRSRRSSCSRSSRSSSSCCCCTSRS
mmetsp:Transcript_19400/g.37154  ORF Transcript_19400/g.37154 Transcript_19400/m.37154 type:complete len:209 (-) Transcript_19400:102-728(-)